MNKLMKYGHLIEYSLCSRALSEYVDVVFNNICKYYIYNIASLMICMMSNEINIICYINMKLANKINNMFELEVQV